MNLSCRRSTLGFLLIIFFIIIFSLHYQPPHLHIAWIFLWMTLTCNMSGHAQGCSLVILIHNQKKYVQWPNIFNTKNVLAAVVLLKSQPCVTDLSVITLYMACSGTFYVHHALSTVLKRATTIKRRGMDVVHQGQPGEEQYGDISSVGEWESGQAHKYRHIECNA